MQVAAAAIEIVAKGNAEDQPALPTNKELQDYDDEPANALLFFSEGQVRARLVRLHSVCHGIALL